MLAEPRLVPRRLCHLSVFLPLATLLLGSGLHAATSAALVNSMYRPLFWPGVVLTLPVSPLV